MAARRKQQSRRSRERRLIIIGLSLVVIALLGFGGGGYVWFIAKQSQIEIDPSSYCPKTGPHSVTAILIDRTDAINALQWTAIATQLRDIVDRIPRYGALTIYTVGPVEGDPLRPEFSMCNPGRGSEINPIIGSPDIVEANWRTGFLQPLDRILTDLLTTGKAPTSPIMESIQSVSVTDFLGKAREEISKRLIMVSDMIQHTTGFSQYHGEAKFKDFRTTPYYGKIRADLTDVEAEILYIRRASARAVQGGRHVQFWEEYFQDQKARLVRVYPLPE